MEKQACSETINNDFYEELAEKWYTASDHPIALLRAENGVRVPWIMREIGAEKTVLDIGCGAGILTNALAKAGHTVHGIDLSPSSLRVAKAKDTTQKVSYQVANAYSLPYPNRTFDVVTAMDVLEHVEEPALLIAEASRVLKPNGQFFFHTFNRNFVSYLVIIKGVEWCVPNTPKNMHVYPLFIKPSEMRDLCLHEHLLIKKLHGFRPRIFSLPFLKMVFSRRVPEDFTFCFSKSLMTGYCGWAQKGEFYGDSNIERKIG
ncbi:MAG TPA: bifunctional 2-polyprenyl-6-hydroxyphenol methylase/3-demethylubiquinol 3-O-methyltransferase UbiG [Chlamydiales bacterium]|nr:bifunctional 2-polyprenyl-6-hydroxyphenol methylase/3-demethylubiquinol 3-O-methyltransferase UbiG [Chlamydiales bacterium]